VVLGPNDGSKLVTESRMAAGVATLPSSPDHTVD
jgi:hypothetical protein